MNFRSQIRKVKILQIDKKKIAIRKHFRHFKIPFVLINFGNTFFEYPVLFKFFVVFFVSSRQILRNPSSIPYIFLLKIASRNLSQYSLSINGSAFELFLVLSLPSLCLSSADFPSPNRISVTLSIRKNR